MMEVGLCLRLWMLLEVMVDWNGRLGVSKSELKLKTVITCLIVSIAKNEVNGRG